LKNFHVKTLSLFIHRTQTKLLVKCIDFLWHTLYPCLRDKYKLRILLCSHQNALNHWKNKRYGSEIMSTSPPDAPSNSSQCSQCPLELCKADSLGICFMYTYKIEVVPLLWKDSYNLLNGTMALWWWITVLVAKSLRESEKEKNN
jgi:hypothetical protein